jgi:pimeloyl-ACP methyl ester carboxylesterase
MCASANPHPGRSHLVTLASNQAIQPQFRTIDGLSIRYAESEDRADQALLLGPWPESLYCYAQTWSRLAERTRLVAIDLPGFGHSASGCRTASSTSSTRATSPGRTAPTSSLR